MVSAAKPKEYLEGIALILNVVGEDSCEHPCVLNTQQLLVLHR